MGAGTRRDRVGRLQERWRWTKWVGRSLAERYAGRAFVQTPIDLRAVVIRAIGRDEHHRIRHCPSSPSGWQPIL